MVAVSNKIKSDFYDFIIIGSGIGGLAAAGLLASNYRVLVLEQNAVLGGYCSDFTRGEFRFESAIQAINGMYDKSPVYDVLKRAGALNDVTFLSPVDLYRTIFPDYDLNVPQRNIDEYRRMLYSYFPDEKNGIDGLFDVMKRIFYEMQNIYSNKVVNKSPLLIKYCRRSLDELFDEYIEDSRLRAVIAQYWMYRGLPPSKLSAITFSYIWYDYTVNGSYYPAGGMADIINNICSRIANNGGEILINACVSRLLVSNERIEGVELSDGRYVRGGVVISNADVFRTLEMLRNHDKQTIDQFLNKLENNSISISAFKIYLGLEGDLSRLGVKNYEIFVNPQYDMEKMYQDSVANNFKKAPYSITIYSNLTDSYCGKKSSVVSIGMLSGYDLWKNLSSTEYKKKKDDSADILLSRAEQVIPGIKKRIKTKVVATPLTMERYTGNSKGAVYGWNKKSIAEEIQFMNPGTPIKNLFLSSHWTKLGGGIGGVLLSSDRVSHLFKKDALHGATI